MKCLPRILPCVALACSLSFPFLYGSPVHAQATPAEAPAAPAPAPAPGADAPPAPAPAPAPGADATPAPVPTPVPGADATPAPAPAPAPGADAAAPATMPAAPGAETPAADVGANLPFAQKVDDFWHYGEIGRYDLQAAIGAKVIAEGQATPEELLKTMEKVASEHFHLDPTRPTDIDTELLRWEGADPAMKPVAQKLIELVNKARFDRRQNQEYIAANIKMLNNGERAYLMGMAQLRNSGEMAVPQLINILVSQKPEDLAQHDVVRRALVDLGREALAPLLAATEMSPKDAALTTICGVIGDIGYPISAPYLSALVNNADASAQVKKAAAIALSRINGDPKGNTGDAFEALAEKFYYGAASIQPDPRSPMSFLWYWNDGLSSKQVPPQIFNDIMTMRHAELALQQNCTNPDQAIALWLAANIRRSLDLPSGAIDPTRTPEEPQPHYYNAAEGVKYLNLVLDRSLKDSTPTSPAVALEAIKSLQGLVGQSNMFSGGYGQPLVEAMRYPDRQVRFEAAFAIAAALPQQPFQGQARVVPLLAEAVQQSGTPGVLVIGPVNDRTKIAADLKGYAVAGGEDPTSAMADSMSIPGVDVIIMSEDLGNEMIDRVMDLASQSPRLERAAKLIIVHSLASPYARMSITDPMISYTQIGGGPSLAAAVEAARKKAGGLPMDEKLATEFAVRASNLLAKLAISRGQILDLSVAEQGMIAALGDKRPAVAKAVGDAVALLNSGAAQSALADRANDTNTAPESRVGLYKSLATSAKFFGNHLNPDQITQLQQVVMAEKNLDIRSAAAEARGALNLPAVDAKVLIIQRHD